MKTLFKDDHEFFSSPAFDLKKKIRKSDLEIVSKELQDKGEYLLSEGNKVTIPFLKHMIEIIALYRSNIDQRLSDEDKNKLDEVSSKILFDLVNRYEGRES